MADEIVNLYVGTKYLQTLKHKFDMQPSEMIVESRHWETEAHQRNSRGVSLTLWASYELTLSVCLFKLKEQAMGPFWVSYLPQPFLLHINYFDPI